MTVLAERIQKYLSRRGLGSRRTIEGWIREGRIEVDGRKAILGSTVSDGDLIAIDQQSHRVRVGRRTAPRIIMYHKPTGEICTRADSKGRPTVFDHLPRLRSARWISVGRLDINTSGLLLFTTDGDLAHQLMHPSGGLQREYRCRIHGEASREHIDRLRKGITLSGYLCRFERVRVRDGHGTNRWYDVVVREGRYREVRRMWSAIGCTVNRLIRIRYGGLNLPLDLKPGHHRPLHADELSALLRDDSVEESSPRSVRANSRRQAKSTHRKQSAENNRA
ncbi:MAG TPA: rRNA pseudouridine synthase [Gammaproteobacteria bacterium]|nr:MAG: 23S rRNA pseudouridylate synthase B [Gammaproteobacteria bacterium]HAD36219.1 23S rRNA pseudouridylate synthase B [Gammaproteobacteria bacterium]HBK76296.1 23S rRNA pseudouridylate synthase B [Gammaproteobacteria bacterium]HIB82554.1 rRNA pseudouridine synthase [Gammaproteobacteria bacterium]HIM86974.1 rRNA pseudouridine synthase [Gammaproteobacteria bacterium]